MLRENLQHVRGRISAACARAGRDPSSVSLVCVTKNVPVAQMAQALALGVTDLGENRVQEARAKHAALAAAGQPVRWHLIGHLQRNKAKHAVELFDMIHSVDSIELAEELERHAEKLAQGSRLKNMASHLTPHTSHLKPLQVLIQANVSGEATKFGCAPDAARHLAEEIAQLPHLRLTGLMTIAPLVDDPEQARPYFRRLREIRDELAAHLTPHTSHLELSMGMSHDFEVAIEEGADLVRIGTAIFGERTTER